MDLIRSLSLCLSSSIPLIFEIPEATEHAMNNIGSSSMSVEIILPSSVIDESFDEVTSISPINSFDSDRLL